MHEKMLSYLELQIILKSCACVKSKLTTPREYPYKLGYKQYNCHFILRG